MEALITLSVAYLYSEGGKHPFECVCMLMSVLLDLVPCGDGKGTLDAINGIKATEFLIHAEALTTHTQPFAWVLFRPPWTPNSKCCKACVFHHMKRRLDNSVSVCVLMRERVCLPNS